MLASNSTLDCSTVLDMVGRYIKGVESMDQTLQCDVAVIGAGTAGLSAYRAVKRAGRSAILIEGGVHGTTCARVGCMPSKLLIAAAEAAHRARHAQGFGVHIDGDRKRVV